MKSSTYFYMKTKILADFQISISVILTTVAELSIIGGVSGDPTCSAEMIEGLIILKLEA